VRRAVALAFILALMAGAAGAYLGWFRDAEVGPARFQGYVEGHLVHMASEEGGRIERLFVEAGDDVVEGQPLFLLESSLQHAQRNEAEARLRQAEAQLANLKAAQQRPEQIAVLRAQEEKAQAQLDLSRGEFERQQSLFQRGITSKARLDQAEAAYERDRAALQEVLRQIQAGQLSGRSAEIMAAEAAVGAAEATLRQTDMRLSKRRVSAPTAADVQDVYFRSGEVVNAGQPVLSLLPPENRRLRFYVPEPLLSSLSLGQIVAVTCDNCPPDLQGKITFISREAEFTPPVIFSEQERAKLVFRVEARPMSTISLPVGLPVTIEPLAQTAPVASQQP